MFLKGVIMPIFSEGHKIIDAEALNDFLKEILPKDRLNSFERNFVAYKIAEHEDRILKSIHFNAMRESLENLIKFIEANDVSDSSANDGDGAIDTWKSNEFTDLLNKAKESLKKG